MVYVDKIFQMESRDPRAFRVGARTDHRWCHMWADSLVELPEFAARLNLRREWAQLHGRLPHYDLVPAKRERAVSLGAREMHVGHWLRRQKVLEEFVG